ncbi:methylated-DNA--[protein]-cysteine S-methyltransferase [Pseudomonas sp. GD03858]|uniref:methylated-DNA--[protein]-cysteine S-methyltransferase n=1 Tax=unclassified Pseudomonas TaxID=196821 RepID=UPI002447A3F1|nr:MULTISPECIES: methylated-DNA--[protein]-cysteine S-methyltransferase [unclassified Pseudomonas]MDH0649589.1 methylated-DNA--[protein]-cysteine S-methyltransferase [Pseudomonas sp. GD03867]MDH0665094.1 methylated-DNA--[protein]-cysteine S-methyltransferase [Pseudomonas sp. GD03858]
MSTHPAFNYNFRTPGSQIEGPIDFAVGQSMRGNVLVAFSRRGVCAIFLGDEAQDLHRLLAAEFPAVELRSGQASTARQLKQVIGFIDNGVAEGALDLDIGGTAFQQNVWQVLCGIRVGRTRSYSDVARELGKPQAVRAVASACAANTLAIVIPCHRVVRSDGAISGYRWGVERKRALLKEEAARRTVEFSQ